MARARLKNTGKALGKRGRPAQQPTCDKCGKPIEVGEQRYEWSFRYGGTYTRHASHGAPRQSETTQGSVSQLYAAQEAVSDALDADDTDYESWRSGVESALDEAADTADEMQSEYEAAAEPFGGQGPNQERADSCESWAEKLRDASSEVANVEVEEPDEIEELADDADEDDKTEHAEAIDKRADELEEAVTAAKDEVRSTAEDAIYDLEL